MSQSLAAPATFAPAAPAHNRAAGRVCIGRVEVFGDPASASKAWSMLEAQAPVSPYQTQAWVLPWLATIGAARSMRGLVSVAYDTLGEPVGLLPLCITNRGPLRLAEFPGGKDANFTFGLIAPGANLTAEDLRYWLAQTARHAPERIDLFALVNQPESWNGVANPLLALGGQKGPAQGYRTALLGDAGAFIKSKMSGESRKKIRAKERRLAELGTLSYVTARDAPMARRILAAFAAQKAQRMQDKGIHNCFADPAAEAFLERGALDFGNQGCGGIELHALLAAERIIATFGGATHQGRFCGMFNSFDLDPLVTRNSPGDLLLAWLIQQKCREGLHGFDLGVGAARYKETWCTEIEPMFDVYVPVNVLGRGMAAVKAGKRRLKGHIKASLRLWALVERLRKLRRQRRILPAGSGLGPPASGRREAQC